MIKSCCKKFDKALSVEAITYLEFPLHNGIWHLRYDITTTHEELQQAYCWDGNLWSEIKFCPFCGTKLNLIYKEKKRGKNGK